MSRDWDAATYDRVSAPQVEWALRVLERLPLRGDETVLDAGCGSGRVTQLLIERLPHGHVVAVDSAPSMVEHAREALDPERATVFQANLTELELAEPVDAAFSNAVFHWVPDHDALFARLHAALRPGGRLVAQCGGEGNVERFHDAAKAVGARAALRRLPRRLAGPLELRRRGGHGGAAGARRLHGDRDLARALSRHAARPHRLPAHRLSRPPPGPTARGAQGAVRGGRPRALRHRARLRPAQHSGENRLLSAQRLDGCCDLTPIRNGWVLTSVSPGVTLCPWQGCQSACSSRTTSI